MMDNDHFIKRSNKINRSKAKYKSQIYETTDITLVEKPKELTICYCSIL